MRQRVEDEVAYAAMSEPTVACPYCAEQIMPAARKCKHCGEWLDKESSTPSKSPVPTDSVTFRAGFRRLCKFLGETEQTLTAAMGRPDQAETNEHGTSFLFYDQLKALFTVGREGFIAHVESPISNSFGNPYTTASAQFELDGISLGSPRSVVEGQIPQASGDSRAPIVETGPLSDRRQYRVRVQFDEDDRWQGLRGDLVLPGHLTLVRPKKMTGWANSIQVKIDDQGVGELSNGSTLSFELPEGEYRVSVRGGMMSAEARVEVRSGAETTHEVYFSAMGILGGGLQIKSL